MIIKLFSFLLISLLSLNVLAARSHLELAIQYAEAALYAKDEKTLVEHAQEAKKYANTAKNEKGDNRYLQQGLQCLNDAVSEAQSGKMNAATKAAKDALDHFKQATR